MSDLENNTDPDLQCSICLDFFFEPLTLKCRHSFCRVCLLQSTKLAPDGRSCPQCRAVIDTIVDPLKHPTDECLAAKTASAIPAAKWAERKAHSAAALAALAKRNAGKLPIFIAESNLSEMPPGAPVSLHFFEPRYRILIRRSWEGERRFIWAQATPEEGTPQTALIISVHNAKFVRGGRANVTGQVLERTTLERCWVEDGTDGLWYASVVNSGEEISSAGRGLHEGSLPSGSLTPVPGRPLPLTGVVAATSARRLGERPVFCYNGLSLAVGARAQFTLFEPRYLALAAEVGGGGGRDPLLLCAGASPPCVGQAAVVSRMQSCSWVQREGGARLAIVSLLGVRGARVLSVREDAEKGGLWYAQVEEAPEGGVAGTSKSTCCVLS